MAASPTSRPGDTAGSDEFDTLPRDTVDGRSVRAQRRREERKQAIVVAAKAVFAEKGYHQASVHDIIAAAGIARGTFYLYYPGKQEVFQELIDEFLVVIRGCVRRLSLAPAAGPPIDQLRANFRRVVEAIFEHEEVGTLLLGDRLAFDDASWSQVQGFFDNVVRMVEDALGVGQALGLIRAFDRHVVAVAVVGGIRAVLAELLRNRREQRSDDSPARAPPSNDASALLDELVGFILHGVRTTTPTT